MRGLLACLFALTLWAPEAHGAFFAQGGCDLRAELFETGYQGVQDKRQYLEEQLRKYTNLDGNGVIEDHEYALAIDTLVAMGGSMKTPRSAMISLRL